MRNQTESQNLFPYAADLVDDLEVVLFFDQFNATC